MPPQELPLRLRVRASSFLLPGAPSTESRVEMFHLCGGFHRSLSFSRFRLDAGGVSAWPGSTPKSAWQRASGNV